MDVQTIDKSITDALFLSNAVLFSGGWDSTYCLLESLDDRGPNGTAAIYFDYGQSFFPEEFRAARAIAAHLKVALHAFQTPYLPIDLEGTFLARNARLLASVSTHRPHCIYFGSRNLLPVFDKHKDSNWLFAQRFSKMFGVEVRTPCTGMLKKSIIRAVAPRVPAELIYSTETK